MAYKRALDLHAGGDADTTANQQTQETESTASSSETNPQPSPSGVPQAQFGSVQEKNTLHCVDPTSLRNYCEKLFKFRNVHCRRFK